MSLEVVILSDLQLETFSEWQAAIDTAGYDLRFQAEGRVSNHNGFLPCLFAGNATGFEIHHGTGEAELPDSAPEAARQYRHAVILRYSPDFNALIAAMIAATAYATTAEGAVYDPQEAALLTPREAAKAVQADIAAIAEYTRRSKKEK